MKTLIELGNARMTFVNASQVTAIQVNDLGQIEVRTAADSWKFHEDQVQDRAGRPGREVLVELLSAVGKTVNHPNSTRIITYLDGKVQSRHI